MTIKRIPLPAGKPSPVPKIFPGLVDTWDTDPELNQWDNELLWILNDDFPPNKGETIQRLSHNPKIKKEDYPKYIKDAAFSHRLQRQIREWVDRWLQNPDPTLFAQEIEKALHPLSLKVRVFPQSPPPSSKPWETPALYYSLNPAGFMKDAHCYWLFALLNTLSRWHPKGLGKCEVCGTYFIDKKHRGKSRCSLKCTWRARARRSLARRKK
jgi:hypothetical protein